MTTWPIVIELAGAPRGKGAPRATLINGRVRAYTDARTRSYESQLRLAGANAMQGRPPTAQPVIVQITASLPVPKSWSKSKRHAALRGNVRPIVKPDCNNFSKCLDGLNGIVWVDDAQIVKETVEKVYAEAPSLRIVVRAFEPPAAALGTRMQPPATAPDLLAALS
jgi:Holliday junction resolvase RusA-like endonuclease